ncbi:MAG TPA: SEC-C metal-binding domain-containing protein [Anaeromyxobacter sp.]
MHVPAFCDSCGAIFASGIVAGGGTFTFTGCAATCPRCGAMARIPDGTFSFIGDTIRLLSGPAATVAQLRRLAEIVRAVRARAMTREAAEAAVASDVPQFAALFEWLRKHQGDLAAWIGVILTAIGLVIAARESGGPKVEVHNVVQVLTSGPPPAPPTRAPVRSEPRVGRNDPCPCGSGKKHKRCCGSVDARARGDAQGGSSSGSSGSGPSSPAAR